MRNFMVTKIIPVLLSILLIAGSFATVVLAAGEVVYNAGTAEELLQAVNNIKNTGAGSYIINLTHDITVNDKLGFETAGIEVTLVGNGNTLTFETRSGQFHGLSVDKGAVLNLGDGSSELIITSGSDAYVPGIVYVRTGSTVNMYEHVTLKDHQGVAYFGGGVSIEGGTFHMFGGTIENCSVSDPGGNWGIAYGGGVCVYAGGLFIMDDGLIDSCSVSSPYISNYNAPGVGGGVCVTSGSSFIMNGGTISNCDAEHLGGGVALLYSSGEYYLENSWGNIQSKVEINDGTITGNTAADGAGVFASGLYYQTAQPIGPALSVGRADDPGLYINGGEISDNVAEGMGGGVFLFLVNSNPVTISDAVITGNEAGEGAGVCVYGDWTKTEIDGCEITDNAAVGSGGGILLIENVDGGETTVNDTVITGNTSGEIGAGVYYDEDSPLTISGATVIQNNTFGGKLNNLNVLSTDAPAMVGDLTGASIGLSDPALWGDEYEDTDPDAQSSSFLTGGFLANNAELASVFTSDHEGWVIAISDVDANEVRLVRAEPVEYIEEITIDKIYLGQEGYDDEDEVLDTEEYFTETVEFTIEPFASFNREIGKTEIPAFAETSYEITIGDGTDTVTVELPDYTDAGVGDYWYKLTEIEGVTAGVTYDEEYYLHVVVTADNPYDRTDIGASQVTIHKTAPDTTDGSYENTEDDKVEALTNIYGHGSLTVTKKITGNMADLAKTFDVTVEFTAPTGKTVMSPITYGAETIAADWTGSTSVTITLGNGESVTFENIPDGVTYTVKEADYSEDEYDIPEYVFDKATETGDTVYEGTWAETFAEGTVSDSLDKVTITNNKDATIDVGVVLGNTPFVVLFVTAFAAVLAAAVFIAIRKRKAYLGE